MQRAQMAHANQSTSLADLLERVLDKGVVIVGDIKIKLVDIELLSIQIRLVICSVDRAREMGLDWWMRNEEFSSNANKEPARVTVGAEVGALAHLSVSQEITQLRQRLAMLETELAEGSPR
jgi:hypothetical protein